MFPRLAGVMKNAKSLALTMRYIDPGVNRNCIEQTDCCPEDYCPSGFPFIAEQLHGAVREHSTKAFVQDQGFGTIEHKNNGDCVYSPQSCASVMEKKAWQKNDGRQYCR